MAMNRRARTGMAMVLLLPLLLAACLLQPGKFESTLDIRADRSFTFTYRGEVIATDPSTLVGKGLEGPGEGMGDGDNSSGDVEEENSAIFQQIALKETRKGAPPSKTPDDDSFALNQPDTTATPNDPAKMEAVAAALRKEKGFRSVAYLGKGKFMIDYAISGKLTHAFLFPFNSDAQAVFPFIVIELRGDDKVRVKAPGYANSSEKSGGMMGGGMAGKGQEDAAKALDGRFTLTTNAEIVSQNQEDGVTSVPTGKQLVWTVNSLTTEAPMSVLKFPTK